MKRVGFGIIAVLALAACDSKVPASNAGVGFNDFADFELERARREAALAGGGFPAPPGVQTQAIGPTDLAAAGIGSDANQPAATQVTANNPDLSDEQDFAAVSNRESIESDAQRRAAAAAARQQVEVTAVPKRSSGTGPNIVAYALKAPNAKGEELYSRSIFSGQSRFERNCAGFNSPDAAQREFLARGGPKRDRLGIDPDGDGFACGWDPAPFKLVADAG